jgi:CRP-like cAMP-binding protein
MLQPKISESQIDETGHTSVAEKMFVLRRTDLFAELNDKDLRQIALLLKTRTFSESDTIIKQGDLDRDVYIIKSGSVYVQVGERRVRKLGPKSLFGELAAIDLRPRSTSIVAAEACCAYKLPGASFLAVLEERHEIVGAMLVVLCRRLRDKLSRAQA